MFGIIRFTIKATRVLEMCPSWTEFLSKKKAWVASWEEKPLMTKYLSVSYSFFLSPYLTHLSFHSFGTPTHLEALLYHYRTQGLIHKAFSAEYSFLYFPFFTLSYPWSQVTFLLVRQAKLKRNGINAHLCAVHYDHWDRIIVITWIEADIVWKSNFIGHLNTFMFQAQLIHL